MAFALPFSRTLARLGLAVLLTGGLLAPADAAQFRFSGGQRSEDSRSAGGSLPFNVDQDPCAGGQRGRGDGGRFSCGGGAGSGPRGSGQHRPGSSAFGLQFNYGN